MPADNKTIRDKGLARLSLNLVTRTKRMSGHQGMAMGPGAVKPSSLLMSRLQIGRKCIDGSLASPGLEPLAQVVHGQDNGGGLEIDRT
jgi:hypothetical protein